MRACGCPSGSRWVVHGLLPLSISISPLPQLSLALSLSLLLPNLRNRDLLALVVTMKTQTFDWMFVAWDAGTERCAVIGGNLFIGLPAQKKETEKKSRDWFILLLFVHLHSPHPLNTSLDQSHRLPMSDNTLLFSVVGVAVFFIALLFCHVSTDIVLLQIRLTSEKELSC